MPADIPPKKSLETQVTIVSACKSSYCERWSETAASNCTLESISVRRYGICAFYRPRPFKNLKTKIPALSTQEDKE